MKQPENLEQRLRKRIFNLSEILSRELGMSESDIDGLVKDSEPKHTYIKETSTQNTGGGCMVDFIDLHDGKVIALNDEVLILYDSYADYEKEDSSCEAETIGRVLLF